MRTDSAVEPTKSENITVTWRRSAVSRGVIVWLRSLGLGKYEAAFRDNEIDETVLPGLTAEDLKELGVAALGHRRKLLEAIAALRAASPTATPGPAAAGASPSMVAPMLRLGAYHRWSDRRGLGRRRVRRVREGARSYYKRS
jgi:hypothetical protein